jgi:hypothetical protein
MCSGTPADDGPVIVVQSIRGINNLWQQGWGLTMDREDSKN